MKLDNLRAPLRFFVEALDKAPKNIIQKNWFNAARVHLPEDLTVQQMQKALKTATNKANEARKLAENGNQEASKVWGNFLDVKAFIANVLSGRQA